jgi:predicted secreted hydrolase
MDREFGSSQLAKDQVGWDWFALRFDDGRALMIYLMRRADGSVDSRSGTLVSADGSARGLSGDEWSVEARESWKSEETDAEYPSRWVLDLPHENLRVEIVPDVANQENISRLAPGLFYWEGSVQVLDRDGTRVGRGHVELTGYGAGKRLPL